MSWPWVHAVTSLMVEKPNSTAIHLLMYMWEWLNACCGMACGHFQAVTPEAGPPGPPTDVTSSVQPDVGTVVVTWKPPVRDGGSPVTQYCVVEQADQVPPSCQPSGGEDLDVVGSLQLGGRYVFGVFAANE